MSDMSGPRRISLFGAIGVAILGCACVWGAALLMKSFGIADPACVVIALGTGAMFMLIYFEGT